MNKTAQFAFKGAGYGFAGGFIFTLLKQFFDTERDQPFKPKWDECFANGAKVGAVGAGLGLAVGIATDGDNKTATLLGTTAFLKSILEDNEVNDIDYQIGRKLLKLQKVLVEKFSNKLESEPQIGGSHDRDVAIISSDHDLRLHFKPKSFQVEEMYEELYSFFDEEFEDLNLKNIRRQTHSLGLYFEIDGEEERIDVVPMQRIAGQKDYNLLVNKNSDFEKNSRIKTNPNKHASYGSGQKSEKQVVKLLKIWRDKNDAKFPSIYLEMFVADCFEDHKKAIPITLEQRLIMTLKYIQTKITIKRIVDPANTNNVISDSLSTSEKQELSGKIHDMLEDIKDTPQNIASYFPI